MMASFNPRSVRAILGGILVVIILHILLKSITSAEGYGVKCYPSDRSEIYVPDLLRPAQPNLPIRSQEPRYPRCSRCRRYEPCEHHMQDDEQDLKNELSTYIKKSINEASTAVMYNDPSKVGATAASVVTSNNNEACWGDTNTDTSKYFKRYANDNASIVIPSYDGIPVHKTPRQAQVDPMSGLPIYVQNAASGQKSLAPINLGMYKEEKVMNGGLFGNVHGMDNSNTSNYAAV